MHDMLALEARGVPSIFVASTEFEEPARLQARSLAIDPVGVFVAHPIQDRTDAELRVLADGAFDQIVSALTAEPAP